MAEAIAGLSIAANVMQVIDFSRTTLATCRSLYADKSPAPGIVFNTKALRNAVGNLNTGLASCKAPMDKNLKDLAQELLRIADALQTEMKKFQIPQGTSKARVLGKALKFNFAGKRKVNELDSSLSKLHRSMQTHVLVRMDKELRDSDTMAKVKLDDLDHSLRNVILQLKSEHTDLESLLQRSFKSTTDVIIHQSLSIQGSVTDEGIKIREHVSSEIEPVKRHLKNSQAETLDKMKRDRLLESLYFEDMNTRSNQVDDAHEETFGWIFGPRDDVHSSTSNRPDVETLPDGDNRIGDNDVESHGADHSSHAGSSTTSSSITADTYGYSNFFEWLENTAPIFWISGKPGSGKSTLIRFLLSSDRTNDILQKCRPGTQIIASFIWSAGTPLQRSIKGLLCTILHSLISKEPSVLEAVATNVHIWDKKSHGDWSTKDLERTFCDLVSYQHLPVCLFIDGLDEIASALSEGQPRLLELIGRLQTLKGIKICLSSRPEPELQNALSGYPSLRLQDLTRNDISNYISSQLKITRVTDWIREQRRYTAEQNLPRRKQPSFRNLSKAVTCRADGIFLWVALVTKAILKDIIIQYDDWNTVLERVDSLPSDMNGLYETLWDRQQDLSDKHREFAAGCLRYVVDVGAVSPLGLLFYTARDLTKRIVGGGSYVSSATLIQRCHVLQHQIEAKCCGLLELYDRDNDYVRIDAITGAESDIHYRVHAISQYTFRFIHRSARDFLQGTRLGKEILRYDRRARLHRQCDHILCETSVIIVLRRPAKNYTVIRLAAKIVKISQTNHLTLARLSALGLDLLTSALRRDESLAYRPCPLLPAYWFYIEKEISVKILKYLWLQYISTSSVERVDVRFRFLHAAIVDTCTGIVETDVEENLDFIELLLQDGGNLITFLDHAHIPGLYHAPLLAGLWDSLLDESGRGVLQKLLQHRLDTTVRFLSRVTHVRGLQFLEGPMPFETSTNRAYPPKMLDNRFITVLADVGYAHLARYVKLGDLVIESLCTEFGDRAKKMFDKSRVAPMKLVLLIDGTMKRVDDYNTVVTDLSAKLLSSDSRLDQVWPSRHDAPSPNSEEKDLAIIREEQARLCEFYDQYESRVLDLEELVRWLVKHDYMAPDALDAEDKLELLVYGSFLEPKGSLIDRTEVNYAEQPEYALFMEEVQRCIAEGLGDTVNDSEYD